MSNDNQNPSLNFLNNNDFVNAIKGYNGWGKFSAIIMYITAGLTIAGGLMYTVFAIILAFMPDGGWLIGLGVLLYCLFTIFFGIMSILMGLKLWKSTEKVKSLMVSSSVDDYIEKSAANISLIRSYFKYQGIMIISYFALMVIFIVFYFFAIIIAFNSYETYNYDSSYSIDGTYETSNAQISTNQI